MSEERLQEIKDSINFQYELIVSKGIDKSALLFTDEEQELLEEVERLNNIINKIEEHFVFLKMNSTGGNKEFMEDILDYIKALRELKGSDKE